MRWISVVLPEPAMPVQREHTWVCKLLKKQLLLQTTLLVLLQDVHPCLHFRAYSGHVDAVAKYLTAARVAGHGIHRVHALAAAVGLAAEAVGLTYDQDNNGLVLAAVTVATRCAGGAGFASCSFLCCICSCWLLICHVLLWSAEQQQS
jgi:hypothetical protein